MSAAARPLISVAENDEQRVLPNVFLAPIRPDIVHFVHSNMNKNARHAYGAKFQAGMGHSAHSWGTGRAVARIPRVSGGGTSRAGQAAFGNMCRKGRMYAQTKTFRKWHRKINTNQKRYAVASALAASALPSLVMARGHVVNNVAEFPLVVDDKFESINKTSGAVALLTSIGAYDDVLKAKASKSIRRGRGKMRNRRHVQRKGPLVVYANDNGIVKAVRNLPGVDACCVTRLNLLQLAPGGHLGRFVVWTDSAFQALNGIWGSTKVESKQKTGYKLPYPQMQSTDITRVINSDEVQSVVRPAIKTVKYSARVKKNPLKNFGTMVKLNPYALTLRRSELLTAEKRAARKVAALEAARNGKTLPRTEADAVKTAARKTHAPRVAVNWANISQDDYEAPDVEIKKVKKSFEVGPTGTPITFTASFDEGPTVLGDNSKVSATPGSKQRKLQVGDEVTLKGYQSKKQRGKKKVTLTVSASKLIKMDWLSKSDPMVALFEVEGKTLSVVGKTEFQLNEHNPKYKKTISIFSDAKVSGGYRAIVFDVDQKDATPENVMGWADISAAQIKKGGTFPLTNTSNKKLAKKLKAAGASVTFKK